MCVGVYREHVGVPTHSTGKNQVESPRAMLGQSPALRGVERRIVDLLVVNVSIARSHVAIVV